MKKESAKETKKPRASSKAREALNETRVDKLNAPTSFDSLYETIHFNQNTMHVKELLQSSQLATEKISQLEQELAIARKKATIKSCNPKLRASGGKEGKKPMSRRIPSDVLNPLNSKNETFQFESGLTDKVSTTKLI